MARGPKVRGFGDAKRNLKKLMKKYPNAAAAGMYKEEFRTIGNAKVRTPVDKGPLRASGFADPPEIKGNEIKGRIGFDKEYAVYVHERTELLHPVGEAKFLENAMNEEQGGMDGRLAQFIRMSVKI